MAAHHVGCRIDFVPNGWVCEPCFKSLKDQQTEWLEADYKARLAALADDAATAGRSTTADDDGLAADGQQTTRQGIAGPGIA